VQPQVNSPTCFRNDFEATETFGENDCRYYSLVVVVVVVVVVAVVEHPDYAAPGNFPYCFRNEFEANETVLGERTADTGA